VLLFSVISHTNMPVCSSSRPHTLQHSGTRKTSENL